MKFVIRVPQYEEVCRATIKARVVKIVALQMSAETVSVALFGDTTLSKYCLVGCK